MQSKVPSKNNKLLIIPAATSAMVLLICLLVTWWLWLNEQQKVMEVMQTRFDSRVNEFEKLTANRVHDYEQVLLGVRGLFASNHSVGRSEFHEYVATQKLEQRFTGAQGLCFSLIIPSAQRERHIEAVRKQGFPGYTITPETPRDFYTAAIFLEPFSDRNQRAFGFDNFTEVTRRKAMEQARDTGELSISGKVPLIHEVEKGPAGIRMYLPVYKKGTATLTVEERRENILGWLYLPIRMNDFMQDALGDRSGRLDVELYDGDAPAPETLLFDSDLSNSHLAENIDALFKTVKTIDLHGHKWTLAAHSLPNFDSRIEEGKQQFIIYYGTGISLLLAFLAGFILYSRARAMRNAQEVSQSEARLSAVIETALDAVIQMDGGGRVIGWNSQAELMFGWPRGMAIGHMLDELVIPPAHHKAYRTGMEKLRGVAVSDPIDDLQARSELRAVRRNSNEFPVEFSMTKTPLIDGSYQFTAFIHDISSRHEREEAQRLASNVLDTVEEAVLVTDTGNRIVRINPAFTAITGYAAQEVIGQNPNLLSAGKHPPEFYREMWESINGKGLWQGEIWDRRKSGETYIKWLTIKAVRDENGVLTHYLGVFSDISERKASEERMKRLAHYDPLTELPNRTLFYDRLQQSISKARRDRGLLALMFIDLDKFKPVNDTYGHAIGDLLLKEVAIRLLDCVRESDTVSRIGGDEFVILLSAIENEQDATFVAGKILHALNEPFKPEGLSLSISSSIGIAIYPEHGDNDLLLTKHADIAMYHAKHGGRNNAKVYQSGMQEAV